MKNGRSDIAIVGMSCLFPGAPDLRHYWENIIGKVDAVSDPPDEWRADLFYDPNTNENDRTYCKRGGWLGELADFDPLALGVMPNAVDGGEPDHFLALRSAYEALEDAGCDKETLSRHKDRTEVIIGRGTYVNRGNTTAVQHVVGIEATLRALKKLHPEYTNEDLAAIRKELKASLPAFNSDTSAGLVPNIISGRIANRFDLMGTNFIVDAACASSLVAVDLAMRDLQTDRCDMAVAGGVHASTPAVILTIFSHLGALSRTGQIRPFDERADGTLLGEGVGMVVLKRLADAETDCDRVYAVIKAVGTSSDGRALGLLAPRREGECLAMEKAYQAAGVDPATVSLVEAHGTGTPVGDETELGALGTIFGARVGSLPNCALGSVKSMISHTMPAAGMAGLIKVALALHHRVLPPTLHCEQPHPLLRKESCRFYVNSETRPWIQGTSLPRRAGVNAFGFGGVNAHAVLEEYRGEHKARWLQREWDSELFVVSADTPDGLVEEAHQLLGTIPQSPDQPLRDLAWTLNCGREMKSSRLAIVAHSRADLVSKIERALQKLVNGNPARIKARDGIFYFRRQLAREGKLALMFPGEGTQYPGMLTDLCIQFPEVREVFDVMDRVFENHPRSRLPGQVVFPPPNSGRDNERIWSMDAGAEAVFSANQALLALLQQLDIRPDAVVGHSTGEHSALLAAGVVGVRDESEFIDHVLGVNQTFEDLSNKIPEGVLMTVAGCQREKLEALAQESSGALFVALDNCVNQVVMCGTETSIDRLMDQLSGGTTICQRLPMARAYHTPWFEVFSQPLRSYFDKVRIEKPTISIYSCVTASQFPKDPHAVRDLVAVGWARTVRFRDTVKKMYEDGVRVFIDAGPRGSLAGFVEDILRGDEHAAIPSDLESRSGILQLHHMLAQLVAHGGSPRLEYLYRRRTTGSYSPSAKPSAKMRLSTGLQPMSLPDDYASVVAAPSPVPAVTREAERPKDHPAQSYGGATATRTIEPAHSKASHELMAGHLRNMERFVESQQKVMASYLARKRTPGLSSREPSEEPNRAAAGLVFIDEILETVPGRKARALSRLGLESHPLFLDHTLGREISRDDPTLSALSVVPLAVTMEILAEGGALVSPDAVFVGMRDLSASRWICFDAPEITLEIDAVLRAPGEVNVRVRSAGRDSVMRPVLAEAIVLFAPKRTTGTPTAGPIKEERPSSWRSQDLYRLGMFHGPQFQAVRSMDTVSVDSCTSTLDVLPRDAMFRDHPTPAFLFDPVAIDAAGQVVAFWCQEVLAPATDIFPYRLKEFECFGGVPAPGAQLQCRVTVTGIEERTLASDIEISDETGFLWYRLKGWEDRRFAPPVGFWQLRIAPRDTFLSEQCNEWMGPHADDPGLSCAYLQSFPAEFYEASHGIWMKALCGLVLSQREREMFDGMNAVPSRRRDWIAGRCAAKDALRFAAQSAYGETLAYADIEITSDERGRPVVGGAWTKRFGVSPVLSIAHSGGVAVAVAALNSDRLIGVDLESVERDVRDFEDLAFTDVERALLDVFGPEERSEWALRVWCAKEAVSKALGRGLVDGLGSVTAVELDPSIGTVRATLSGPLNTAVSEDRRVSTYTRQVNGFVFGVAVHGTKPSYDR